MFIGLHYNINLLNVSLYTSSIKGEVTTERRYCINWTILNASMLPLGQSKKHQNPSSVEQQK